MPRSLRLEFEGAHYHVMNRAWERRCIFESEKDHVYFMELLNDINQRWAVKIYAYCLMGNHYHLFLQTPQANLSRVMRHVNGLYTQYFNRTRKRDGPVFKGRFKSIIVDAESYLLELLRYIHLNPVKAKLVHHPARYHWSSHRLYLQTREPAPWLDRQAVLSHFAGPSSFDEFVCSGNDRSLEAFYRRKRLSRFLGDSSFATSILKRALDISGATRAEATPQFSDLDALIFKVSQYYEMPEQTLLVGRPGQKNTPRNLAIYIASRKAGFSHPDIRRKFDLGTNSAVSRICQRTHLALQTSSLLQKNLQDLMGGRDMCQVNT